MPVNAQCELSTFQNREKKRKENINHNIQLTAAIEQHDKADATLPNSLPETKAFWTF